MIRAHPYVKTEAMSKMTNIEKFEAAFEKIHTEHFVEPTIENPVTYDNQLRALEVRDQDLILIGTLDAQVQNGGFSQWICNGYSEHGEALLKALKRLDLGTARTVIGLVVKALELQVEPQDVEDYDGWANALDKLDDEYYAIQEVFFFGVAEHFCG